MNSTCCTAFQIKISNQELFEKHLCNPHILKEMVPRPSYINYHLKIEVSITFCCWLCSTPLHSSTNQELFEKHLCNQSINSIFYGQFPLQGKPSHAITKLTLFAVSKDEWDTKEDTGKSMKNALYVLWYAKRHL